MLSISDNKEGPELGGVLSVACGMYRYVFYRCVSVAWEIADGSLWNVSVYFLSVCVGCLGDRAYCFPIVLPSLLPILPLLHNTMYCCIEPGQTSISDTQGVPSQTIRKAQRLGGVLSVACGMYRYVCLSVCVGCLGDC